jgi:hypothetical protein
LAGHVDFAFSVRRNGEQGFFGGRTGPINPALAYSSSEMK